MLFIIHTSVLFYYFIKHLTAHSPFAPNALLPPNAPLILNGPGEAFPLQSRQPNPFAPVGIARTCPSTICANAAIIAIFIAWNMSQFGFEVWMICRNESRRTIFVLRRFYKNEVSCFILLVIISRKTFQKSQNNIQSVFPVIYRV